MADDQYQILDLHIQNARTNLQLAALAIDKNPADNKYLATAQREIVAGHAIAGRLALDTRNDPAAQERLAQYRRTLSDLRQESIGQYGEQTVTSAMEIGKRVIGGLEAIANGAGKLARSVIGEERMQQAEVVGKLVKQEVKEAVSTAKSGLERLREQYGNTAKPQEETPAQYVPPVPIEAPAPAEYHAGATPDEPEANTPAEVTPNQPKSPVRARKTATRKTSSRKQK